MHVLIAIAIGGRRVGKALRTNVDRFRVAFGVILAVSAFALIFNVDTKLQKWFPNYTDPLQRHTEASGSGRDAFQRGKNVTKRQPAAATQAGSKLPDYGPAPDFAGIDSG